jgi:hypothetical protein
VYLAGPYDGAPISVLAVIPAVSGPYDIGTVAVRSAVRIDRRSAQVSVVSDPLPQLIEGVPLRTRSILANLDRSDFALNPTRCDPFSIDALVSGDDGGSANQDAFYQIANCAALHFSPKLSLRLRGSTKRRGHPGLRAVLTAAPGEANLRNAVVTMPKSLLLDNAHIGTVCTRTQFAVDACPAGSLVGTATVVTPLLDRPLSGGVYLRSSGNKLPDLVVDLEGQIDIELVGRIDTTKQGSLRANFEAAPDAPVTKFVLEMNGRRKGLLINSASLCVKKPEALVTLTGQNGMRLRGRPLIRTGCGGSRGARRSSHRRGTLRPLRARVTG